MSLVNSQIHGHGFTGTSIVVVLDGPYRGNVTLYMGCDYAGTEKAIKCAEKRSVGGDGDGDRGRV